MTDQGVYLRTTDETLSVGPVTLDDALQQLTAAIPTSQPAPAVIIAAEASITVHQLMALMQRLTHPTQFPVALGVTLSPQTQLPATLAAEASAGLCDELPPISPQQQGDLAPAQVIPRLRPVQAAARTCFSAHAARAGRIQLDIRVAADGSVSQVCASTDTVDSAALRTCLFDAVQAITFPAPDPSGAVNLRLPLVFTSPSDFSRRAVCDSAR